MDWIDSMGCYKCIVQNILRRLFEEEDIVIKLKRIEWICISVVLLVFLLMCIALTVFTKYESFSVYKDHKCLDEYVEESL